MILSLWIVLICVYLLLLLKFYIEDGVDIEMSKKKCDYEMLIDDEVKYVISAKHDDDALEVVLDVINKEGNFTGITLICTRHNKRRIVAKIEGE